MKIVLMNVSTDWIERERLLIRGVKRDKNEDVGLGILNQVIDKTKQTNNLLIIF